MLKPELSAKILPSTPTLGELDSPGVYNMRCNEFRPAASSHLDQRLTLKELMRLRAHAEICAGCRAYLIELEQMSLILKGAEMADASPGLRGRIMSLITAESAGPS